MYLHATKPMASLSLRIDEELSKLGMGMDETNVLFNYTSVSSQAMKDGVPWRGAHEKDVAFYLMVVEALTQPGDLVLDPFASIGELVIFAIDPYSSRCLLVFHF